MQDCFARAFNLCSEIDLQIIQYTFLRSNCMIMVESKQLFEDTSNWSSKLLW